MQCVTQRTTNKSKNSSEETDLGIQCSAKPRVQGDLSIQEKTVLLSERMIDNVYFNDEKNLIVIPMINFENWLSKIDNADNLKIQNLALLINDLYDLNKVNKILNEIIQIKNTKEQVDACKNSFPQKQQDQDVNLSQKYALLFENKLISIDCTQLKIKKEYGRAISILLSQVANFPDIEVFLEHAFFVRFLLVDLYP